MNDPRSETAELYLKPVEPFHVEPLLNTSFPVPEGRSFFDDFPAWTTERALWMGLYREGDVLQAAAGALPAQWSVGSDKSPVSIVRIGGVVTQESARGQGLASQLVEELVHLAMGAGAQGVVLWG
ncbi:MAG: GNAT family N-acetyltransferase, partial [Bdellovibrionales bacterium]|nr:GNAT family N-acetyltransferase [Bdellovibrionales bacterium]